MQDPARLVKRHPGSAHRRRASAAVQGRGVLVPAQRDRSRVALAMVGLPARGKSYIARKIARYLSWLGHKTRVFNVGSYRRAHVGSRQPNEFFDPDNESGAQRAARPRDDGARRHARLVRRRRRGRHLRRHQQHPRAPPHRRARAAGSAEIPLVFIESICDDPAVIDANVRETKLTMPDYAGIDPEEAVRDFRARIAHYERVYEPVDDDDGSYIKIIDVGQKVVLNRIARLPARPARPAAHQPAHHAAPDLAHAPRRERVQRARDHRRRRRPLPARRGVRAEPRPLRARARPGAGAGSPCGRARSGAPSRPRCRSAAQAPAFRALDEIDAGICDGMTYEQIREQMPDVYAARKADKFRYRYPRGESYEDVIQRLDPLIIELERQTHAGPGHRPPGRAARALRVPDGQAAERVPPARDPAPHRHPADADGVRLRRAALRAPAGARGGPRARAALEPALAQAPLPSVPSVGDREGREGLLLEPRREHRGHPRVVRRCPARAIQASAASDQRAAPRRRRRGGRAASAPRPRRAPCRRASSPSAASREQRLGLLGVAQRRRDPRAEEQRQGVGPGHVLLLDALRRPARRRGRAPSARAGRARASGERGARAEVRGLDARELHHEEERRRRARGHCSVHHRAVRPSGSPA